MAITGSSLAAIAAGIIPDAIPMAADTPNPKAILEKVSTKSSDPRLMKERSQTRIIPKPPPITLKKTDSNKNWKRIK